MQVFTSVTKTPSGQNYEENTGDSDNITMLAVFQLWPFRTWSSLYDRAHFQLTRMKALEDDIDNLDDELMVALAESGGILGIGYWDGAVCDYSPAGIVSSIRYAIDLMGVDHVALGSDYDGATTVRFDTSELAVLTQTMVDNGFAEEEIASVMGGNVKKFFLTNLPSL